MFGRLITPQAMLFLAVTTIVILTALFLIRPWENTSTAMNEQNDKKESSSPAVSVATPRAVAKQDRSDTNNGKGGTTTPPALPLHTDIIATVFWVGEDADASNDFINNRESEWLEDWVTAFGGIDTPDNRCGYAPCGFTPKENTFYFALPFGDFTESGQKPKAALAVVPWYDSAVKSGEPLLKNRWIEVTKGNKKAYAQWEDVGPFESNDAAYVFGTSRPKEPRAGIDLSPAVAEYLGIDGRGKVSWRFIDKNAVPDGPWKTRITISPPAY